MAGKARNMVKVVVAGVSGKCDDGKFHGPSAGFYRNTNTTCLGARIYVVGLEGWGSFETVVVSSRTWQV